MTLILSGIALKTVSDINKYYSASDYKGIVVVTAQNFVSAGPLSILNYSIPHIATASSDFLVICILNLSLIHI